MAKKEQRVFTQELKREAVQLAQTSGKSMTQIAHDLGISDSALHAWRKQFAEHGNQAFPGKGHQTELEEENRRVRRENDILKQEREVLKRAMPWRAPPRMNKGRMSGRDANARTDLFA